jgi:hypothetical protein
MIECSWEYDFDDDAKAKWIEVYNWFKGDSSGVYSPPRDEIANDGLIALNLIGRRRFVIAGQTLSNRPLQHISSMITLNTPIKVDVFPATNVFEFGNVSKEMIGFTVDKTTGKLMAKQT